VKSWDTIIVGAGIIGLSLAIELRKRGLSVLIVEKGQPGREASHAAGGMLVDFPPETNPSLQALANASTRMYPEFVHELEDESGRKIDLRSQGTLYFLHDDQPVGLRDQYPAPATLSELEPAFAPSSEIPLFLRERCVDPRDLTQAAIAAARHREVDFSSDDEVIEITVARDSTSGVRTRKTHFAAGIVVNCAGAWAGQISPIPVPTRPVKGQMLCVAMPEKELIRHTIRGRDVYLIPRSDGRLLIGTTLEEAGFDKQTVPDTLQKLRQAALDLVPRLADARILEAWAGLRPGTPDNLPILGRTEISGYFAACGHYRDGIMLSPITAHLMAAVISDQPTSFDISKFSPARFANRPGSRLERAI
jgi:glycine oxidase